MTAWQTLNCSVPDCVVGGGVFLDKDGSSHHLFMRRRRIGPLGQE